MKDIRFPQTSQKHVAYQDKIRTGKKVMQRQTDEELLALLNDTESDRAERKESLKGDAPKKARQAICAFANDLPGHNTAGVLFIGAKDNGDPSGCEITDRLLTALADMKIDEEKIGGAIIETIRRTMEKLMAHNRTAIDITSMPTHQLSAPYPPVALQQILYNAILHRTYENTNAPIRIYWFSDRIEISSPGGPYGNVTSENFGRPGITDYRNPNIADVMKTFGFVQAFGRGIATAQRAMINNGNPQLEFVTSQSTVLCILRGKP